MQDNTETIATSSKEKPKKIAIAPELHRQLKKRCNEQGLQIGAVTAILIVKYLNGQTKL